MSYATLLSRRETWALLLGKFLTDPVWWFYLYWLPGFLYQTYGLNLTELGLPLIAIYLSADVGSVGGGWLSSGLLARGWSVNRARKVAMLTCALAVVPVALVARAGSHLWVAVALVSVAAAAHQGWSANMYTLASDIFPKKSTASIVGLSGFGGAAGGMLVAPVVGYWLQWSHSSYGPLFVAASSMYLVGLGVIHPDRAADPQDPGGEFVEQGHFTARGEATCEPRAYPVPDGRITRACRSSTLGGALPLSLSTTVRTAS